MPDLPSFKRPPVTEVVIAADFEADSETSIVHFGDLARSAQAVGFSEVEERPPHEGAFETFGDRLQGLPQLQLQLHDRPPLPRFWFLNEGGDELLQVQRDWFACNWRKVAPGGEYDRWDPRWEAFERWHQLVVDSFGEDDLVHTQVEVTYINHIHVAEALGSEAELASAFSFLSPPVDARADEAFLPVPESFSHVSSYVIPGDQEPVGRLHLNITPATVRETGEQVARMSLTARGRPIDDSTLNGVRRFAEVGHEWIVQAFASLTSRAMHDYWERES